MLLYYFTNVDKSYQLSDSQLNVKSRANETVRSEKLCRFQGARFKGFISRAGVGGATVSGFVYAPFHQLAGQKRERQATASQSLEHLHLPGFMRSWTDQPGPSIRMWRAVLAKLVVILIFCTFRCHSQGKSILNSSLHCEPADSCLCSLYLPLMRKCQPLVHRHQ